MQQLAQEDDNDGLRLDAIVSTVCSAWVGLPGRPRSRAATAVGEPIHDGRADETALAWMINKLIGFDAE
jgi:hypothetical protein